MSSDHKQKDLKSKSRYNQIHSKSSSGITAASTYNDSEASTSAFSLLDKLDMKKLKKSTVKYVKGSPSSKLDTSSSTTRKACIDYALEMVISNLIVSGQLDPQKAHQMRTPVMKTQIASMCDKILERRAKKAASIKKLNEVTEKKCCKPVLPKTVPVPSITDTTHKSKGQKWAIQPTALPITIITNKDLSQMVTSGEQEKRKLEIAARRLSSLQKSFENITLKIPKKKRSKSKASSNSSLESPVRRKPSKSLPPPKGSGIIKRTEIKRVDSGRATLDKQQQQLQQQKQQRVYQASSEVPSNFSVGSAARLLSNPSISDRGGVKARRSVQFEGENESSKARPDTRLSTIPSNDTANVESGPDAAAASEGCKFGINANDFPGSCPGTAKTLNSFISSTTSVATVLKEFQILVDMKGFLNDEIAMEVEGRRLIFLASRPKRNEINMRNVTEVVELPATVKMENLKIGRRKDGFVVIEEHEADQQ